MNYYQKYLKYKNKYINLKGGTISECEITKNYEDEINKLFYSKPEDIYGGEDKYKQRQNQICSLSPEERNTTLNKLFEELNIAVFKLIKEFECIYNDYVYLSKDTIFKNQFKSVLETLKKYKSKDLLDYTKLQQQVLLKKCIEKGSYEPYKYYIDMFMNIIHKSSDAIYFIYLLHNSEIIKHEKRTNKRLAPVNECNSNIVKTNFGLYDSKCCDFVKSESFKMIVRQLQRINMLLKELGIYSCDTSMKHLMRSEINYIDSVSSLILPKK